MFTSFSISTSVEDLEKKFEAAIPPSWSPSLAFRKETKILVLRGPKGQRDAELMDWGFLPESGPRPLNSIQFAKAETVHELPAFSTAIRSRRCAIIAEWLYFPRAPQSLSGATGQVSMRPAKEHLFCLAGIWNERMGADGHPVRSCAVVTTVSSSEQKMRNITQRMPVILLADALDLWLDQASSPALLKPLYDPILAAQFQINLFTRMPPKPGPLRT